MSKKAVRVMATVLVLGGAVTALMYRTLQSDAAYYKHVDEVMTQPNEWYGKKLQLHGFVVPDSIGRRPNTLDWQFKVQSNGHVVTAWYTGVTPDTFKSESEVVLKGTLDKEGFHVQPNGVMAKCPSKYEAKPGAVAPSGKY